MQQFIAFLFALKFAVLARKQNKPYSEPHEKRKLLIEGHIAWQFQAEMLAGTRITCSEIKDIILAHTLYADARQPKRMFSEALKYERKKQDQKHEQTAASPGLQKLFTHWRPA